MSFTATDGFPNDFKAGKSLSFPRGVSHWEKSERRVGMRFLRDFRSAKKRNDSDFEQNQAIFAVRKKRNDSDFKQNQAIFAVRKQRNGSDFEQNQQIFSVQNSRET